MVVQHNISAMTANRYYGINNKGLASSLEKLASGYAINKAGDNAAGLAVSEKMRAQIGGLTQASKNAEDGISMVQTFEGALQETDSILQRMRTLAVQSANGTYANEVDRDAIQLEFDQLNDELNQIADTDFNGVVMLNGGVMADGTVANNSDKVADRPSLENVEITPDTSFTYKSVINGTVDGAGNGTVAVNGTSIKLAGGRVDNEDHKVVLGGTEYTADVKVNNGKVSGTIGAKEVYKIDDQTTSVSIHGNAYSLSNGKLYDSDGNAKTEIDGLGVTISNSSITLEGSYGVSNDTVNTAYRFTDDVNKTSGALTQNSDGTISGNIGTNGVSVKVTNGTGETTTSEGIKYAVSGATLDVSDGTVGGTITVSGEVNANAAVEKNINGKVEDVKNSSNEVIAYKVTINGKDAWANKSSGALYQTQTDAIAETSGKEADETWFSQGGTLITSVTKSGNSTDGFTYSAASKTQTITIDGKDYNYAVKDDGSDFDAKVLVNGTASDKVYFGDKGEFTATIAADKATASGSTSVAANTKGKPDEVGSFKLSKGVSTSNAYEHGSRNLTFADSMTLQVGARAKDAVDFNFSYTTNGIGTLKADMNASARGLGTDQLSVKSAEEANYAIDQIDNAINKTNMIRATFGAVQNRLEHKINNIDTNTENLTASESRIRDTQMDKEMMKFTSAQILSQASQSMLAQANSLPQGVLQLLG